MKFDFKKIIPHLLVLLVFVVASVAYFSPILNGKQIKQSDIAQYIGMSKQFKDYNKTAANESYWNDAAFGGMPTYQLGANYPHNYIKKMDHLIRFLPRPADYVFLYFICFYILLLVLRVDWRFALLGSLAFGFSTYFIIILGVGHNAKAHAIAYMPLVLAGIFLVFQKKYVFGFLLTAFAMGLELNANHFQMTYYLLLLVLVIGIVFLVEAYKTKQIPHFFKSVGILSVSVILALGLNATNLMATSEYANFSTRSKSELTINANGSAKVNTNGLDKGYITEYSYGIGESLNVFVPRLFGGSNNEPIATDAVSVQQMQRMFKISKQEAQDFSGQLMYWADQSYVAAPAYIGAVVIFLFVLALFLVKGRMRRWVVIGGVLVLLLSWGKNFMFLTDLFIDYVPLYNKFRAVSSIQVILEMIIPLFAVFGLYRFVQDYESKEEKLKALKYTVAITAGLSVLFYLLKGSAFNFVSPRDGQLIESYGPDFIKAIKEQRELLFTNDVLRTLVFVLLAAAALWLHLKDKLKENALLLVIGCLIVFDLVGVDKRYVNQDDFVNAREVNEPFNMSSADKQILKDESHYNVLDLSGNPFNSARASYFHNAFGGYHAAKPKRASDLFEFYVAKNKISVVNMLNIKYIIQENKGQHVALNNPYANGNAWFINTLNIVENSDEEILALDTLNLKNEAVISTRLSFLTTKSYQKDSLAKINLTSYKPNHLVYESKNAHDGFTVFSEMYYEKGWNATIDGVAVPILKVNYALRGLDIPKGNHEIEFKFEPQVIQTGSTITLATSILLLLLLLGGLFFEKRKSETK